MNQAETEIYKQHRELQNKYTYFLLAIAASCIALSLKRTTNSEITRSMIFLFIAVLSWGSSFFCGCRYSIHMDVGLHANADLLVAKKTQNPDEYIQQIKKVIQDSSKKCGTYIIWQFRFLWIGSLFFIGWHIIEMIKKTINSAC